MGRSTKKRRRESKKHGVLPPVAPSFTTSTESEAYKDHSRDNRMITHFRPMLCVDFLGPGELLVVERPLVDVLATLPPAYFKHKYGVS
jgi:U3 small nucleolar RNA-associated protein 4